MNWKNLFLAGLVLSLSPVTLKIQIPFFPYNFLYSLLGSGMILISFLYKDKSKKDYFAVITLLFALILGLAELFIFYNLFLHLFFLSIIVLFLLESANRVIRIFSYILIGSLGFYFPLFIGNYFGLITYSTVRFLDYSPYFYIPAIIILFIFNYKEM